MGIRSIPPIKGECDVPSSPILIMKPLHYSFQIVMLVLKSLAVGEHVSFKLPSEPVWFVNVHTYC